MRPGEFALNKLWLWGPSVREEGVVRAPEPDAAWNPVHEADVADVAVVALTGDGHAGKAYTFGGPHMVSRREQVGAIARAVGRPVRLERVSPERAREYYRAQGGFAAENADMLLGFTDYGGDAADPQEWAQEAERAVQAMGEPETAEQATGRPARTFEQWARDHAADFR
ncbi:Rossmann-fold NAD(P)-binding domain-containing protein [Nocardiopsis suaedae]|uniref:NmrA-like domain-containing protein n=1 Tax=Nocardiopsis suaedae TaxID=3018444 RepID=A0ABT4TSN6_9ACTN|nr:hypothetical protein [Nocardiopsis suaedae]MDA2807707.1 hypothetical protein [Nocardiopsis suaedae]